MDFELDRRTRSILRALGGTYAEGFVARELLPCLAEGIGLHRADLPSVRAALACPYRGLKAFYSHYAFLRRGRDRFDLARAASLSLDRVAREGTFEALLGESDAMSLWDEFDAICRERGIKNHEQLNRGLVAGIAELAQDVYRNDGVGSIVGWVTAMVARTDRIEPVFQRIVAVRGVGPKATSTFLRDVVFLFGLEDVLDPADQIFVQPIDKWLRLIAELAIPELSHRDAPDWIIAGKVAKYARRAGVSGLRVNMGASYFGLREARDPARLAARLEELAETDYPEFASYQA